METKSPWNEYGEAKIAELEHELTRLTTILNEQQTNLNKIAEILGKVGNIFDSVTKAGEDDRK